MYLFLLALLAIVSSVHGVVFTLSCTGIPEPCNNDCFGVYVNGQPSELTYKGPQTAAQQKATRKAAGCITPGTEGDSPCGTGSGDSAKYLNHGNSCDEYPFASTEEGGTAAVLRCMDNDQNRNEGSRLSGFYARKDGGCGGTKGCKFTQAFSDYSATSFCGTKQGPNDGYEFELLNGEYEPVKRGEYAVHYRPLVPDPAHYFAPHLRREFLLTDNSTVLVLTTDLEKNFDDEVFLTESGLERIVRELKGMQKSPHLRHPDAQEWSA